MGSGGVLAGNTAKKEAFALSLVCGQYSKKEAAEFIEQGVRHVHSTALKDRDPLVRLTEASAGAGEASYPWEAKASRKTFFVAKSAQRATAIATVVGELGLKERVAAKVGSVLEELITNGIYHGYQKEDGSEKYERVLPTVLEKNESLKVCYELVDNGVYLSVEDQGGHLTFEKVGEALGRCHRKDDSQVESKAQGAGLGLYMVFDYASHMKVVVTPGRSTTISCWIPTRPAPVNEFSFNFFVKGQR